MNSTVRPSVPAVHGASKPHSSRGNASRGVARHDLNPGGARRDGGDGTIHIGRNSGFPPIAGNTLLPLEFITQCSSLDDNVKLTSTQQATVNLMKNNLSAPDQLENNCPYTPHPRSAAEPPSELAARCTCARSENSGGKNGFKLHPPKSLDNGHRKRGQQDQADSEHFSTPKSSFYQNLGYLLNY
ncbi:hypothetical protein SKAU_G00085460 [Synaphobranchus kaupii]|uniref:Uncharacterized protein n=1 Tax=Synaphobranchus kaupii TaxID=118154 RepID=A0A9Q1FWH3_SYNKA|nr:hypothetical protein SKAU_G00085460 [Synaphobranchus kaupii]